MGVNGLISDRPDLLQGVLAEERAAATTGTQRGYLDHFDVAAHRGGRGLRPENTLPSFESGARASGRARFQPGSTICLPTAAGFLPIAMAQSSTGEYTRSIFQVVTIALLASRCCLLRWS